MRPLRSGYRGLLSPFHGQVLPVDDRKKRTERPRVRITSFFIFYIWLDGNRAGQESERRKEGFSARLSGSRDNNEFCHNRCPVWRRLDVVWYALLDRGCE